MDDASGNNAVARKLFLSKLNSPAYASPVNASPACYQDSTHDSGPRWVASPSSYGSFTHYSMSVYPDAFCPCHCRIPKFSFSNEASTGWGWTQSFLPTRVLYCLLPTSQLRSSIL